MGKKFAKRLTSIALALMLVLGSVSTIFAATSPTKGQEEPTKAAAAVVKSKGTNGNVSKKTIDVIVKKDSNAVEYKIAYRTKGGKWKYETTTKKTYTIEKLKKKGLYEIKVAGINKDGKTGKYSSVSRRYLQTVKSFKATASKKGKLKVTAKNYSGATGYQVRVTNTKTGKVTVKTYNTKKNLSKTIKLKKGTYKVTVRPLKKSGGKVYLGVLKSEKTVKVK